MSAYSADKKTLAYQLGESLSQMTDHFLLMTATPHKGDPENFCLFLSLLDRDVYGNVKSLEKAMRRARGSVLSSPLKEALVTFPDPETGRGRRALHEAKGQDHSPFKSAMEELDFYDAAHSLRRGSVNQGRAARILRAAGPSASRWRCSSADLRPASTPCAEAWSA